MSDAPPATPVPAATILLVRDAPAFEVLMVKRHHQIDFASGALVFPGGKAEPGDQDPAWAELAAGWRVDGGVEQALKISALREAFEESGLLLAAPPYDAETLAAEAAAARDAVARGERSFIDLVRTLGVRLDLEAMAVYARWITPRNMPKRFDTWFFIAAAPEAQLAVCDGWETVDAEWVEPAAALALADAGARKIIFPTRMNLLRLAESGSVAEAMAAARARAPFTVEPQVERREGEVYLVLPEAAGYGRVEVALSAAV